MRACRHSRPAKANRRARRRQHAACSLSLPAPRAPLTFKAMTDDEQRQTKRDLRAALIFGVIAATLEMGALIWFFR
jgi:hypothetical protein